MKYNILLPVFMLFISLAGFSQAKQYVYYFDKDFNPVEKTKSIFNGIGICENGRLELRMYNTLDKNLVSIEHYTDSSLQVTDGLFQSYYRNALELEGNYLKGKENGLWVRRDTLGQIIDSSVYDNGEKIMEAHIGYNKNGSLDSFIINHIKSDRLQKTYYDDNGKVLSEVSFTGQSGIVKRYDKGALTSTDTVNSRIEIEASFPGGDGAWTEYIFKHVKRNIDALTKDDQSGTCRVRFIVGKDGKVRDVEAITMQGSALARVSVNAIKNGPKWIPALQYGRHVNAYREQPVSFTIQEE